MSKRIIIVFILALLSNADLFAQTKQHMLGVRAGYNISGLDTRPDLEYKSVTTNENFSILYTYYHNLWGTIDIFGIQTGISSSKQGYKTPDGENLYEVVTIPVVSQFHFDFWKMRILLNAGCFGGYRQKRVNYDGSGFDEFDNKVDLGFIAGGGLAFIAKPFELHVEGNYHYSLTYLHDPKKYSPTDYLFTYPKQLIFSVALHIHL